VLGDRGLGIRLRAEIAFAGCVVPEFSWRFSGPGEVWPCQVFGNREDQLLMKTLAPTPRTYPAIAAIARCNGIMAARSRSCRGLEVFANHTRVTSRDSQEADGWTFRLSPTLLPVSKRMDANAHRLRKLRLG
jgi:hypothetical protein